MLFLGISAAASSDGQIEIAYSAHDGTYSIDFAVDSIVCNHETSDGHDDDDADRAGGGALSASTCRKITEHIIRSVREYTQEHSYKFIGAGITQSLAHMYPGLATRLWLELDITSLVFEYKRHSSELHLDEEADAMARKCVVLFGPNLQLRLHIGLRNEVGVDAEARCRLATIRSYQDSVRKGTWTATLKYINILQAKRTKIAFFSSTPQGGGVALMRHALVRFFNVVGIDCKW